MTAIAWVFPDGRLPSPRWRPWALAAALSFAGLIVCTVLEDEPFSDPFADVPRPLPDVSDERASACRSPSARSAPSAPSSAPSSPCGPGSGARPGSSASSCGGSPTPPRWSPLAVAICLLEVAVTGEDGPVALAGGDRRADGGPGRRSAIAILRYRLYEIDRLINRTLVYARADRGAGGGRSRRSRSALGVAVGSGSTLATAAATLAVALLFGPLRARVQLLVDRRFDRARYEGLRTVERFLEDLRAGRAAPGGDRRRCSREALGDPGLELLFRLPSGDVEVDAAGRVVEGPDAPGRTRTPVRRGGARARDRRPRPGARPSGPTCSRA